ncbi:2-phospho-L-lactate guanylyltransferase [Nocardia sp. NPDC088792]|uniref:2-phospho-L-lactate guanylyltransferase n=1 Tax=Nocardia sp. NPDC088792 TaxID=3364332 RepID=UPI0037F7DFD5
MSGMRVAGCSDTNGSRRAGTHVHAIIAVKNLGLAKSRLADHLPAQERPRLVLAMLADTVTAAVATPGIASVTVVTPDPTVAELVHRLGAQVHPEPPATEFTRNGHGGLNAALAAGAAAVRERHGTVDLLALQADLPAMRPQELAEVLAAATQPRAVVADHEGSGTVALLARDPQSLDPLFGRDSARRHIAAGAIELLGEWPGLRQDVDTAVDLERAVALGVGEATRALLNEIGVSRACQAKEDVHSARSSVR